MIKAICFDVGGTLIKNDKPGLCSQLCAITQKPVEELLPFIDKSFRTSRRDLKDTVTDFCNMIGYKDPLKIEKRLDISAGSPHLYLDVIPSLEMLKNYKLGIISNAAPWDVANLSALNIHHYFHAILYSFDVGFAKPDARIFREMEKQLECIPGEFLFVGDSIIDIDGSQNAGWKSVYILRQKGLSKDHRSKANIVVNSLLEIKDIADRA